MTETRIRAAGLSAFEIAQLRLSAFSALRGWGQTREDGKWSAWNGNELRAESEKFVAWAIDDHRCSLCGKFNTEVKKLVVGWFGAICDECVLVCVEVLKETLPAPSIPQPVVTDDRSGTHSPSIDPNQSEPHP